MCDEFTKRWSNEGFSEEEARKKQEKVDSSYGVYEKNSKWNPSKIVPDHSKTRGGYKIVISTK